MRKVEVTRLSNGEVIVDGALPLELRFHNQEEAHTWLTKNGYKIIGKSVRGRGDHISGFYITASAA